MRRRAFVSSLLAAGAGPLGSALGPAAAQPAGGPRVLLPELPAAAPLGDAVLLGCDDRAFPFRQHVAIHLAAATNPLLVLEPGPAGSVDEVLLYYGTVIRIGDTFHMWYNGNHGPLQNRIGYERVNCRICYARSADGIRWEKPKLGLVDFKGSKANNIVELDAPTLWSTAAVLHDPEETDPARRFKMAFEARYDGALRMCVATSPDGLRWRPSPRNPVAPFLEMAGIARYRGLYYCNGQASFDSFGQVPARRLSTFVSGDFERWSPCAALGLDRTTDLHGPSGDDRLHQFEEIHLGAALWNRGNVLLGIYGQWHGDPSGDRRRVVMDLGLALSHDALHFHEPIRGFRFVPAREQPDGPTGFGPALMQGQGMENVGERTLYWYSLWRGTDGSGVRLVSWPRDRFSALKPFHPAAAEVISCLVQVVEAPVRLYANASGLGAESRLRVSLLDDAFAPVPGFSGADAVVLAADAFRAPVRWPGGDALPARPARLRIEVRFEGLRPEDARLHALYLGA